MPAAAGPARARAERALRVHARELDGGRRARRPARRRSRAAWRRRAPTASTRVWNRMGQAAENGTARRASVPQTAMAAPRAAPSTREEDVLGEQQSEDAPRAGPQGQPHSDLALARARPGQHQVGRVPADGEEQQEHQRLQDPQRARQHALGVRAGPARTEGPPPAPSRSCPGRGGPARCIAASSSACARARVACGGQRSQERVAALAAVLQLARPAQEDRGQRRRDPEVEVEAEDGALESRRRDPDDGQALIVEAKGLAEGGRRRRRSGRARTRARSRRRARLPRAPLRPRAGSARARAAGRARRSSCRRRAARRRARCGRPRPG